MEELIAQVNAYLPQRNCGRCGFSGCESFAAAVVQGRAEPGDCLKLPLGRADRITRLLSASSVKGGSILSAPRSRTADAAGR